MYQFAQLPDDLLTNPEITPEAVRVYSVIDLHSNTKGYAWPGITRIGSMAHVSRPCVIKAIHSLEAFNYLVAMREERKATVYFIPFRNAKLVNGINQGRGQSGKPHLPVSPKSGKPGLPEVDTALDSKKEVDSKGKEAASRPFNKKAFFETKQAERKRLEEAAFDKFNLKTFPMPKYPTGSQLTAAFYRGFTKEQAIKLANEQKGE